METRRLPERYDVIALDGSEIRLLPATKRGSMVHCTLTPGGVSMAVAHRTVEEIWFFLEGEGEVWRSRDGVEQVTEVRPGTGLTLPVGTHFQFRNTGDGPLRFLIVTMPPWSGEAEAYRVADHWPAT